MKKDKSLPGTKGRIMKRLRLVFFLLGVFVLAVSMAFYCEDSYRGLVRFFFNLFQGDKIKFTGKNFHLFASTYFVVAFGIFSILFTLLMYEQGRKGLLIYSCLTIAGFFITTIITTYFDSANKVVDCTACQDGIKSLHYNAINYDFHFITSLAAALVVLGFIVLKQKFSRKNIGR
jgi:MFS family permease